MNEGLDKTLELKPGQWFAQGTVTAEGSTAESPELLLRLEAGARLWEHFGVFGFGQTDQHWRWSTGIGGRFTW